MPPLMIGVVLEADANRLPCEDTNDERTDYYLGAREGKSNECGCPLQLLEFGVPGHDITDVPEFPGYAPTPGIF